jgi:methyltransferase (TIGR00027 family)
MPVPASLPTVGLTALGVAAIRAAETARSDRLFADPCAARFVRAAGYERSAGSEPSTKEEVAERQRLTEWVGVRTRFLDDVVRSACAQGCRQVVILGAGLDARAFRLEFPEGTRLWELDLAGVLSFKEMVVQAEAWVPRCERTTVEIDLSEDWGGMLQDAGFDARAQVVWVAEGLLAYLSAEVRDALIVTTAALSVAGSRFGLTLAARTPTEELRPASTRVGSKPRNYKALFQSTAPDDPRWWLAAHGWRAELFDVAERSDSYGRPPLVGASGVDRARLVDATRA